MNRVPLSTEMDALMRDGMPDSDTWVCCAGRDNGDMTADLPYVDDSVIDCKDWEVE